MYSAMRRNPRKRVGGFRSPSKMVGNYLDGIGEVTDNDSVIEQFKTKLAEFRAAYASLVSARSIAAQHPALMAEYQALINRGGNILNSVNGVLSKLEGAWDVVSGTSEAAWENIKTFIGMQGDTDDNDGLGFIPIIIAGAALAVIALITSWIADAVSFRRKLDAVQKLTLQGIPLDEAARSVQGLSSIGEKSISGNLSSMAMWAAIAAFAIFVLPKLLERR